MMRRLVVALLMLLVMGCQGSEPTGPTGQGATGLGPTSDAPRPFDRHHSPGGGPGYTGEDDRIVGMR